jgi:hypothetical protein
MSNQFRTNLKYFVIALIVLLLFELRYSISSDLYWSVMAMDGENTAYDYLSSTTEKRLNFANTMCDNGVCLHPIDWRCGFTIDSLQFESANHMDWHDAVDSCFGKLTKVVPPHTSLDKVRKICGRFYMQFDPPTGFDEQDCVKSKGNWGVKFRLYLDEEELLSKAKIEK